MAVGGGRLSRWTRKFTVASASVFVLVQAVSLLSGDRHIMAVLAVLGFICPMIFGMAYLLLPSFVGRTLVHQRVPAMHFGLAYSGTGAIVVDRLLITDHAVLMVGVALWSLGVIIFVGELLWTTLPGIFDRLELFKSADDPPQSPPLWMVMIPIAIGYLLVGTLALLGRADVMPDVFPPSLPSIIHYYGAGFGGLLIFALGTRLLPVFSTPPCRNGERRSYSSQVDWGLRY